MEKVINAAGRCKKVDYWTVNYTTKRGASRKVDVITRRGREEDITIDLIRGYDKNVAEIEYVRYIVVVGSYSDELVLNNID